MKKVIFIALVTVSALSACSSNKTGSESADSTSQSEETATSAEAGTSSENQPKSYNVVVTPDSALLGKQSEALIRINGGTAVALQDPEGKDAGIELTLKLTVTNKTAIGGNGVSVSYNDSRLKLDNGTNLTAETGSDYLRADPESTSKEESWTYKLPAGTKPSALNLFMNETRASVNLILEDK